MNKDQFANLANHMDPSYESKELCRKIINQVTMILSEYVMYTREKYPNTVDFVAVGSSGDGLSVSLSLMKDMLRYVFDDDKIIVTFNNSLAYLINILAGTRTRIVTAGALPRRFTVKLLG